MASVAVREDMGFEAFDVLLVLALGLAAIVVWSGLQKLLKITSAAHMKIVGPPTMPSPMPMASTQETSCMVLQLELQKAQEQVADLEHQLLICKRQCASLEADLEESRVRSQSRTRPCNSSMSFPDEVFVAAKAGSRYHIRSNCNGLARASQKEKYSLCRFCADRAPIVPSSSASD